MIIDYIQSKLNTLRIGQKFSMIVVMAVIIPFILIIFLFSGNIYGSILNQTIREKQTEISQIEPIISQYISRMTRQADFIRTQTFFRKTCISYEEELTPSYMTSQAARAFSRNVRSLAGKNNLKAVRIYLDLPEDNPVFSYSNPDQVILPMSRIQGAYWHGIFSGSGGRELYCPPFYLSNWEKNNLGDLAYIQLFYCKTKERLVKAYLCLYYPTDMLKQVLTDISKEDGTVSYIINNRDAIVTSTSDILAGIYHLNYEDIYEYLFSSNNYMEKDVIGQKVYLTYKTIPGPEWFLINVVPESLIQKETTKTILEYLLVTILILTGTLLITTWFSNSLANRISSVISTMSEIRKGSMKPMEEPEIKDEIGELIQTYNYMTDKQRRLTENLKQTADELRIAEVNALQAQINPHFLYNTLDTIQWMAITGKEDLVSTTVQKLSRFYRLTLGKDMTNTTIEKEIEHASIYVDLQNLRFDDAISFLVDIPGEMNGITIPRLTLQPIVENAILHGIREKESQEGCIVITGWEEEKDIYLMVSDDGIGIEEEFLPKILSTEGMNPNTKGTNIAIYNVHHRLQLLYGEDYGLSYESRLGEGTEVTIHLPKI